MTHRLHLVKMVSTERMKILFFQAGQDRKKRSGDFSTYTGISLAFNERKERCMISQFQLKISQFSTRL
ncbi:hypothetical protein CR205_12750 [Alteribacter lacisalsi]|uniref:Uncharacterized protein n=1 Tax=Alteribacter lacisalsi TaxID=2045244 RepID=A0A2W0HGN0_9BACI|nr:hypothetical protein CR205_12750 [Alteribacter lacisalsi]